MKTLLAIALCAFGAQAQTNSEVYPDMTQSLRRSFYAERLHVTLSQTNSGILVTRDEYNPVMTNLVILLMNGEKGNSFRPLLTINPWTAATNYTFTNVFTHPHVIVSSLPVGVTLNDGNGAVLERGGMSTNFNELMVITTVVRQEVLTFEWNGVRSVTNEVIVSSTRKLLKRVESWAEKP